MCCALDAYSSDSGPLLYIPCEHACDYLPILHDAAAYISATSHSAPVFLPFPEPAVAEGNHPDDARYSTRHSDARAQPRKPWMPKPGKCLSDPRPVHVSELASKLFFEHILKHLLIKRKIFHNNAKLAVCFLLLIQTS